jgi:hypothetical protein
MAVAQVGVDFADPSPAPSPETHSPRLRGALPQPAAGPRLRGEITPVGSSVAVYAPLPPVAARPISETSPYALPTAARAQTD